MPYISTEEVKIKRNLIKKTFPEYKFSIRGRDYSSIDVVIKSGPIDLLEGSTREGGYDSVNHYYIKDHYEDRPEIQKFLLDLYAIMNKNNGEEVYDGDYGSVPNFYVSISIGDWENSYKVIKK